jgi:hypothetical protein
MTLELTTPIVSLNKLKGRHWGARHNGKTAWQRELTARGARRLAPPTPPDHRQVATITRLLGPGERPFDFENLAGGNAKSLVDALTDLGFWRDDSPAWLDRAYAQRKATPAERAAGISTIVTVEAIS